LGTLLAFRSYWKKSGASAGHDIWDAPNLLESFLLSGTLDEI
jgi:hypothetical protein